MAHRAKKVNDFISDDRTIHPFFLPPYAPELNPVENVWSYLKTNSMANVAPVTIESLAQTARNHGRSIQRKQNLLRSFLKHTPLSVRIK